jgi:AcrR family transcriptional regulator
MVALILQAAARVLQQHSLAGFNTNRVADVAGISVGSLYQYFPNKAAVVAALVEQFQAELALSVEQAVASHANGPLPAALEALAEVAIGHQYGNSVLAAALDAEELRLPLADRIDPARHRMGMAVHGLLAQHWSTVPAHVVKDCLVIAKALVEADAPSAANANEAPQAAPAGLKRRVVAALLGYLQHSCTDPLPQTSRLGPFRPGRPAESLTQTPPGAGHR